MTSSKRTNEIKEENGIKNCGNVTPKLVISVANEHFKTKSIRILFDDFYEADHNFKYHLDKILKGIGNSAVIFGKANQSLEVISRNEQPAWVIFSAQPQPLSIKGNILVINHISPFHLKEWLMAPKIKNDQQLVVVSDPALKELKGLERECDVGLYRQVMNADNFGTSKALILTSWRSNNFTQNIQLFSDQSKVKYNGIHLVIAVKSQPPFIFKRVVGTGEVMWEGLEVRLIHMLKEILNFTVEFRESTEKGSVNGIICDLKHGQADLGVGGLVVTEQVYQSSSIIYPHYIDSAAFISLASIALPKYRAIMGPFLLEVWVSITLCYVIAILPIAFSAWHTLRPLAQNPAEIENMFWYVFGTFTNCFTFHGQNSWTKGSKYSTKLFIGTYWMFTIIITACYTGSIIAFITLPVYPDVIDSMHQILHNNYRVLTLGTLVYVGQLIILFPQEAIKNKVMTMLIILCELIADEEDWWALLTGSEDDEASGLAGTARTVADVSQGLSAVIKSAKEDEPLAFLGSAELLSYIVRSNFTSIYISKRQMFHISRQCFVPTLVSMTMPHRSAYVDSFSNAIMRASEAGFLLKIKRELEWTLYKDAARQTLLQGSIKMEALERQLSLDDTQGMFLLLGCGFTFACAALIFELGNWLKNRQGEKITVLAKQKIVAVSRRVSQAILSPSNAYIREHYPLYFRTVHRRKSSIFGSNVSVETSFSNVDRKPPTAVSDTHLMPPPVEKPIRLLSF